MDTLTAAIHESKRKLASEVLKGGESEQPAPKKYMRRGEIAQLARKEEANVKEAEQKEKEKKVAETVSDPKIDDDEVSLYKNRMRRKGAFF